MHAPIVWDLDNDGNLTEPNPWWVTEGKFRKSFRLGWFTKTYTFIPSMEGEYKVVVTFTTETETLNFSSED